MKTDHKISLHLSIACIAVLCTGLTFFGPGCDLSGEDDGDVSSSPTSDAGIAPTPDVREIDTNIPDNPAESVLIEGDGEYSFLKGEVILTVIDGALSGERLELRKVITTTEDEQSVIGYIWGPHGIPIDPPAALKVTLSLSEITAEKPTALRLISVSDDGALKPLEQEEPTVDSDRITFRAAFAEITDLTIQVPEL